MSFGGSDRGAPLPGASSAADLWYRGRRGCWNAMEKWWKKTMGEKDQRIAILKLWNVAVDVYNLPSDRKISCMILWMSGWQFLSSTFSVSSTSLLLIELQKNLGKRASRFQAGTLEPSIKSCQTCQESKTHQHPPTISIHVKWVALEVFQLMFSMSPGVLSLLVVNMIAIAQKSHLGKLQRRQAEVGARGGRWYDGNVDGKMDADGKMDVQDCYIRTSDDIQMMNMLARRFFVSLMFFGQLGFITVSSVESKWFGVGCFGTRHPVAERIRTTEDVLKDVHCNWGRDGRDGGRQGMTW